LRGRGLPASGGAIGDQGLGWEGVTMQIVSSIVDILIILLFLRAVLREDEVFLSPIHRLIFRITDPLLKPSGMISRKKSRQILLTLSAIVLLRGLLYMAVISAGFLTCVGLSLLELIGMLFECYVIVWFISVLPGVGFTTAVSSIVNRALLPLERVISKVRRTIGYSRFLLILLIVGLYVFLSSTTRYILIGESTEYTRLVMFFLGQGMMRIFGLFMFPGFFSVIIILGALLSWFSPDPYNPLVQAVYALSEPILMPFRRVIPSFGGLDFSPLIALLCLQALGTLGQQMVLRLIMGH
jgi:YggT family protein